MAIRRSGHFAPVEDEPGDNDEDFLSMLEKLAREERAANEAEHGPLPPLPTFDDDELEESFYEEVEEAVLEAWQTEDVIQKLATEKQPPHNPNPNNKPQKTKPRKADIDMVADIPKEAIVCYSPGGNSVNLADTKVMICVSDELREHYDKIIEARDDILCDPEASGGEKAAILNATTSVLKELVSLQSKAHNSDTLARLQQAIINGLAAASEELKERVLTELESHLEQFS